MIGACRRCGLSQFDHVGKNCAQAVEARDQRMAKAIAAAISPAKKATHCYVGAPAIFKLELACKHINQAFGEFGCYGVGSAWERPDWRDVDVRYIMQDKIFDNFFPRTRERGARWEFDPRWLLMTGSISMWLNEQTGLPVDFQFQPQSHSSERHGGKPRHPLGLTFSKD